MSVFNAHSWHTTVLLFKAEKFYSPFIVTAQNRATSTYSTFSFCISWKKASFETPWGWEMMNEFSFFGWNPFVKTVTMGWMHNHTHSYTPLQPPCQRENTLFYLWLMRNTKLPLASLRLLSVYWFKCYSYPPMTCRADLLLRWMVLWLGIIECLSFLACTDTDIFLTQLDHLGPYKRYCLILCV